MELTDREFMIKLESKLDRLSEAIERLGVGLSDLEGRKISAIQEDIADLKNWKAQISGGWKLAVVLWVILTVLAGLAIKNIFR